MKSKDLFLVCAIIFMFGIEESYGQDVSEDYINITTPNVASFNKFIDNPIDKYHGRPEVTIPLYTIKDGDIELPLSVRYNTSGIKVNEEASWVGLGWNLNVGGVVTQNVIGQYDEYDTHYESFMSDGFFETTQGMDIEENWEGGYFDLIYYGDVYNKLYCAVAGHDYCTRQLAKMRPDVFYFSYPGNSGKFIIDYLNNGTPCILRKEENIEIQIIAGSGYPGIKGFKIVTPKGIVHTFDTPLEMKSSCGDDCTDVSTVSYRLNSTSYPNGQSVQYYYSTVNVTYATRKEMHVIPATLIEGFDESDYDQGSSFYSGEEIYLDSITTTSYKIVFETSPREDFEGGRKVLKMTIDEKSSQAASPQVEFDFSYDHFNSNEFIENKYYWYRTLWPYGSNYASKRLKLNEIITKNGGIEKHRHKFTYNETQLPRKDSYAVDYWGYYNGKNYNETMIPDFNKLYFAYVNGMTENRAEETTYINGLIDSYGSRPKADRSYDFNYAQAAMLKGIEYPTKGYTEFEYEPNTFSEMGVKRKDGYEYEFYIPTTQEITSSSIHRSVSDYNIGGDDTRITTFTSNYDGVADITVTFQKTENQTWEEILSHTYIVVVRSTDGQNNGWSYNDFSTDEDNSNNSQQITRQITLPAGAYEIEVDYPGTVYDGGHIELNFSLSQQFEKPMYSQGCGFRIKSIKQYKTKSDTNPELTTNYDYTIPGTSVSSGLLFDYLSFVNSPRIIYSYLKTEFSSALPGYIETLYSEILTMHYISGNNRISNPYGMIGGIGYSNVKVKQEGQSAGSTEYEFHNHKIFYWENEFLSEAGEPTVNSYPILNGKTKSIIFYNSNNNEVKKERYYFNTHKFARILNINAMNRYNINVNIFLENNDQVTSEPIEYVGYASTNDASIHVQEIFGHKITLERKEIELDNVLSVDSFKYNAQMLPIEHIVHSSNGGTKKYVFSYPGDINQGIYADMVDLNMINYPVEQSTRVDGKWTNGRLSTYKFEDGNYVADKIYSTEITTPLTNFTEFDGTNKDVNYSSSPETEFLDYDSKGNIVKTRSRGGIYNYYLWAYNEQYPIAKIETSNSDIGVSSLQANVNNINFSHSDALSDIQQDISSLSTALSSVLNDNDCQITFYTYKPLVGMTSQTDPAGRTTYFQYDDFGRLKLMRDQDNNIVSKNEYHYATQQ